MHSSLSILTLSLALCRLLVALPVPALDEASLLGRQDHGTAVAAANIASGGAGTSSSSSGSLDCPNNNLPPGTNVMNSFIGLCQRDLEKKDEDEVAGTPDDSEGADATSSPDGSVTETMHQREARREDPRGNVVAGYLLSSGSEASSSGTSAGDVPLCSEWDKQDLNGPIQLCTTASSKQRREPAAAAAAVGPGLTPELAMRSNPPASFSAGSYEEMLMHGWRNSDYCRSWTSAQSFVDWVRYCQSLDGLDSSSQVSVPGNLCYWDDLTGLNWSSEDRCRRWQAPMSLADFYHTCFQFGGNERR